MGAAAGPTLLEYGTKLVGVSRGYWGINLFPDAGEGIVTFHSAYRPVLAAREATQRTRKSREGWRRVARGRTCAGTAPRID